MDIKRYTDRYGKGIEYAAIIALILLGFFGLSRVSIVINADTIVRGQAESVVIPDLFALSEKEAREALSSSDIQNVIFQYGESPLVDKGFVTAQSHPAGTPQTDVDAIYVTISSGPSKEVTLDMSIPANHGYTHLSRQEYEMFSALNEYRRDNNLQELQWDRKLYVSAVWKAMAMGQLDYMGHENPQFENLSFKDNLLKRGFGYEYASAGENLAQDTIEGPDTKTFHESMKNLKNSPTHNESMLSEEFTKVAIAVICIEKMDETGELVEILYTVQHFAR